MILKLLMSLLKSKLEDALAKAANKSIITVRGVAHGVRIKGQKYEMDVVLRREEPKAEFPTR